MRATSPLAPNALRMSGLAGVGHVESWFLRANHPTEARAIWLKATVLAPLDGPPVAEAWCVVFGEDRPRGGKRTAPLSEATLGERARVAGCEFAFGPEGTTSGAIGDLSWDLRWIPGPPALARPLSLLPHPALVTGPLPRNKTLTPVPVLRLSGTLVLGGRAHDLSGWTGMQGHNWGREHAPEYAWGQCAFTDPGGEPICMVEGFTARVRVGPLVTPRLSAMVVRRGEREYRFDRTFDAWRQRARIETYGWKLHLRGRHGEAVLWMHTRPEDMACLRYANPDGRASYCMNSKLASVHLRVEPANDAGFECRSATGGALELLRSEPDPAVDVLA